MGLAVSAAGSEALLIGRSTMQKPSTADDQQPAPSSSAQDGGESAISPDEAAPGVGAPGRPDAMGEDPGDAARRAAGADPAAS